MNRLFKHFFLFSVIFLFLVSVSFAADELDAQETMEKQVTYDKSIEDKSMEYDVDDMASKKSLTTNDTQKNIKSDEDTLPVEYVNITQSNYKNYFTVMGGGMYLGRGIVSSNNSLVLNMQYFPDNINILGFDENSAKFTNRSLTITSDRNLSLTNVEVDLASNFKEFTLENINFKYNNDYTATDYLTIYDSVQHCVLRNVTIDMNRYGVANGYLMEIVGRTTIENSFIRGRFMETVIDWLDGPKTPDAYGIRVYAKDCVLRNNTIEIISSGNSGGTYYSLYGIYVMKTNTTLTNNTIILRNCTGYAYGVVVRSSNNTISCNNITVSSQTYSAAVNLEIVMFKNNIVSENYINVTASYGNAPWGNAGVAYGLEMLDFNYNGGGYNSAGSHPTNNSFVNNTIVGSAGQIYGIEIYGTSDTNLSGNTINITGRTPMGIGVIGSNITIANNNIINNGTHNRSEGTADYLEAINTGLYTFCTNYEINMINNTITSINGRGIIIKNSFNNLVTNNTINVTGHDYAVEVNSDLGNNTIENNTLITTKHTGDRAVSGFNNSTVQNNIPVEILEYSLQVDTTEFTLGSNATLISRIYYGDEIANSVNKGKVSFKANGKTLKDVNGKVIYAKVVNGTATIENYTIPDTWDENTTIQAVYSGSTDVSKLTSDKTSITITQSDVNDTGVSFTTESINTTTAGTVVLKATITDGNKLINTGKVAFKINGKTVKDANGKVIYAKVINNTVSVEYALPESYKAGSYNLTAVFIASGYDKLVDTKTLIIA